MLFDTLMDAHLYTFLLNKKIRQQNLKVFFLIA